MHELLCWQVLGMLNLERPVQALDASSKGSAIAFGGGGSQLRLAALL